MLVNDDFGLVTGTFPSSEKEEGRGMGSMVAKGVLEQEKEDME